MNPELQFQMALSLIPEDVMNKKLGRAIEELDWLIRQKKKPLIQVAEINKTETKWKPKRGMGKWHAVKRKGAGKINRRPARPHLRNGH